MNRVEKIFTNKLNGIKQELNVINGGGCLLFAYEIKKALAKRNIKSQIVLVDVSSYDVGSVESFIKLMGCKGINSALQANIGRDKLIKRKSISVFGHCTIRLDNGSLFDSNGRYHGNAISKPLTNKTIEMMIGAKNAWNPAFKYYNDYNNDIVGTMEKFVNKILKG